MNDLDKLEIKLSTSQESLFRMFHFISTKFPDVPSDIIDPVMKQHEQIAIGIFEHKMGGDLSRFKNRFRPAGVGTYGTILTWLLKPIELGETIVAVDGITIRRSKEKEWAADFLEVVIDQVTFRLTALMDIPSTIALIYDLFIRRPTNAPNLEFSDRLRLLNASVATLNKEFMEVAAKRDMFSKYDFKPNDEGFVKGQLRVKGAGMINVRIKTDDFGWVHDNLRIIETGYDGFDSNIMHRFHVASILRELMDNGEYETEFPKECLEDEDDGS
tara:strand:- start:45058 stop:45873 length:816 start_codon:yes stop_codon:yes gene_type:complete